MAYKTFQNGYPLPASDLNNYLMNQSVIVFASSAARTADIPTPIEGMITYLEDTNAVEVWDGSAWQNINDNSNSVPLSTVTTEGDLIVADGASSVTRLGVGTADQVLTTDGTNLSWNSPSYVPAVGSEGQVLTVASGTPSWEDAAGGGGAWTLLGSFALGGLTQTTVSGIDQSYKYLRIQVVDAENANTNSIRLQTRNSSSSSLNHRFLRHNASSTPSWGFNSSPQIYLLDGSSLYDNNPISIEWTITDYASTSRYKPWIMYGGGSSNSSGELGFMHSGQCNSYNAISEFNIYFFGFCNAGTLLIYGGN